MSREAVDKERENARACVYMGGYVALLARLTER